jgi:hypothetical protein
LSKYITIGDVRIPLEDFAISGTAWLGIKKAGKTYGAKGVAEQLMEHGIPLIVFDAIGVWRFLKTAGDGPGAKGFKVVVAGGEQADIPLSPHNAAEIVRAAMRSNVSLVIDLYDPKLSKGDWRKIVQTCFHTLLYENKSHGTRYIILEEAAEYVPQKVYDGETYAAVEKLVRMGGNAGLGIALVNQRSQEVNKAVLDLCDNLVLMRQRGNAAIDAVQKWMDKVSPDIADKITASLPNMSGGDCWVWAENSDTPVETKTRQLHSYHPDRTKGLVDLKTSRQVDTADFVEQLLAELPKVVEEKKANDPAELKRTIRQLQADLAKAQKQHPAPVAKAETKTKEKAVLKDGQLERAEKIVERLHELVRFSSDMGSTIGARLAKRFLDETEKPLERLSLLSTDLAGAIQKVRLSVPPAVVKTTTPHRPDMVVHQRPARAPAREAYQGAGGASLDGELTGTQQQIINTIFMLGARGLTPNREMVAAWIPSKRNKGLHPNGGRYGSDLAFLRETGFLVGCELTTQGMKAVLYAPLTGLDAMKSILAGTQVAIVEQIENGTEHTRDTLAEALGIHPNGGRYGSDLARLRTMGVIPERGTIKLMEEATA